MKKERNRGAYYDSLIRNMSTIIFLISSFFEKKREKVSILLHHFSLLLLWNMNGRCSTLHCLFYLIINF